MVCREVQRILMELLNQMDGFDQNVNVKVSDSSLIAAPCPVHLCH
jgi:ATP-dependent 26S proteasome regulatory subunit